MYTYPPTEGGKLCDDHLDVYANLMNGFQFVWRSGRTGQQI